MVKDTTANANVNAEIVEIIEVATSKEVTPEIIGKLKTAISALSPEKKDILQDRLAELGFFSKGSLWNLGMLSDIRDVFRPNIGAGNTALSIVNVALKGGGLAGAGYLGYKGSKSLLQKMGVCKTLSTAGLAAAATPGGACCGA